MITFNKLPDGILDDVSTQLFESTWYLDEIDKIWGKTKDCQFTNKSKEVAND